MIELWFRFRVDVVGRAILWASYRVPFPVSGVLVALYRRVIG